LVRDGTEDYQAERISVFHHGHEEHGTVHKCQMPKLWARATADEQAAVALLSGDDDCKCICRFPESHATSVPTMYPTPYPTAYPTASPTVSPTAGCTPGMYINGTGDSRCESCPLGTFSAVYNAVQCEPCAAGTFAGETGLASCVACPTGYWSEATGAVDCLSCNVGYRTHLPYQLMHAVEADHSGRWNDCYNWNAHHCPNSCSTVTLDHDITTTVETNGTSGDIIMLEGSEMVIEDGSSFDLFPESDTCCSSIARTPLTPVWVHTADSCIGSSTEHVECFACKPGHGTSAFNVDHCTECTAGFYSLGGTACLPCPIDTTSQPGAGACV
jgi:hypothetical protein